MEKINEDIYPCMWTFKNINFTSNDLSKIKGAFSFVYMITIDDKENNINKMYIGQKMLYTKKTVTKNKISKKVTVESDWKKYFSSSDFIKNYVLENGYDNIKREILYICFSKGQANYLETKLQFELGCLENNDIWLNGIVNCRCHHTHLKLDKLIDSDKDKLIELYKKYSKINI